MSDPRARPSRLHVDWTRCDGHGLCAELLPEMLERDDWGYPVLRTGSEIPARLHAHARHAEKACPLLALRILPPAPAPPPAAAPARRAGQSRRSATKTGI